MSIITSRGGNSFDPSFLQKIARNAWLFAQQAGCQETLPTFQARLESVIEGMPPIYVENDRENSYFIQKEVAEGLGIPKGARLMGIDRFGVGFPRDVEGYHFRPFMIALLVQKFCGENSRVFLIGSRDGDFWQDVGDVGIESALKVFS